MNVERNYLLRLLCELNGFSSFSNSLETTTTTVTTTIPQSLTSLTIPSISPLPFQRQQHSHEVNDDIQMTSPIPLFEEIIIPSSGVPLTYYINSRKLLFSDQRDVPYEIFIRPDCSEESVISFTKTVLVSVGGLTNSSSSTTSTSSSSPSTTRWSQPSIEVFTQLFSGVKIAIHGYLGVNQSLRRVLLFVFSFDVQTSTPSGSSGLSSSSSSATSSATSATASAASTLLALRSLSELRSYAKDISNQIAQALHSNSSGSSVGGFTLLHLYELVKRASQPPVDIPFDVCTDTTTSSSHDCGLALSSVVCDGYICDFQSAVSVQMTRTLSNIVDPLDKHVKQLELSCARLMTLLKGSYQRSNLQMPAAPVAKPLSEYPLELSRNISISDVSLEMSRMLILRARKIAKSERGLERSPGGNSLVITNIINATRRSSPLMNSNPFKEPTNPFDIDENTSKDSIFEDDDNENNIVRCLGERLDSESVSRLLNHIDLVIAILINIRSQLIDWVEEESVERLKRKHLAVSGRINSIEDFKYQLLNTLHKRTSSGGMMALASADRTALNTLVDRCRVIDPEKEPLLLEIPGGLSSTSAATVTMNGRSGSLYITMDHLFFYSYGGIFLTVILKLIPIIRIRRVALVRGGALSSSGGGFSGSSDGMLIEDEGGNESVFEISGTTPDFCSRVVDFVSIIKQLHISGTVTSPEAIQKALHVPFNLSQSMLSHASRKDKDKYLNNSDLIVLEERGMVNKITSFESSKSSKAILSSNPFDDDVDGEFTVTQDSNNSIGSKNSTPTYSQTNNWSSEGKQRQQLQTATVPIEEILEMESTFENFGFDDLLAVVADTPSPTLQSTNKIINADSNTLSNTSAVHSNNNSNANLPILSITPPLSTITSTIANFPSPEAPPDTSSSTILPLSVMSLKNIPSDLQSSSMMVTPSSEQITSITSNIETQSVNSQHFPLLSLSDDSIEQTKDTASELLLGDISQSDTSEATEKILSTSTITISSAETIRTPSPPLLTSDAKRPNMARNIQAFLAQSQNAKK